MGFFDKLKQGLSKTKSSFDEKMNNVFSNFRKVDEELLEELEEALIMSDVGVETSTRIIGNLRERIKKEKIEDEEGVKNALREEIQFFTFRNKSFCYFSSWCKWSRENYLYWKNSKSFKTRWKKSSNSSSRYF